MRYELYYWPGLQGRGEFVRLAFEEAGADYVDIALVPEEEGGGVPALTRFLEGDDVLRLPFAPPFLKCGKQLIGQTANILLFLGGRLKLAPVDAAGKLWTHQLQLTLADLITEVHDTHHPIDTARFYEEQRAAAKQRSTAFLAQRLPKYLGYFERVLERSAGSGLVGDAVTYIDLSMAQVIAGLQFAFPSASRSALAACPRLRALHDAVFDRPRLKAYLASGRRVAFNNDGIFRRYPELDI